MKPMLAATVEDVGKLSFPLIASPKLDGVRAIIMNGTVLSRSLKPIPNQYVQRLFGRPEFEGLDGELVVGGADNQTFNRTTSAVMSRDGEPDVDFIIFDNWRIGDLPYTDRLDSLVEYGVVEQLHAIKRVPSITVVGPGQLARLERKWLRQGYEGVMLRHPDSLYKHGRSTLREGALMKLKRFVDDEAVIVGVVPWRKNLNPSELNELGYRQKSTRKAGMEELPMLGAFQVEKDGVRFEVGTGFTVADREALWKKQDQLIGQLVKYKYQPIGTLDRPRFPVYLGLRHPIDL